MVDFASHNRFISFAIYTCNIGFTKCNRSRMPGADRHRETGYREPVRQGEKEEEGEREIESPWGPIRGSSEGL